MSNVEEKASSALLVACKVCGDLTAATGTQLCNACWALERQFRSLALHHPDRAAAWLVEQVRQWGAARDADDHKCRGPGCLCRD